MSSKFSPESEYMYGSCVHVQIFIMALWKVYKFKNNIQINAHYTYIYIRKLVDGFKRGY